MCDKDSSVSVLAEYQFQLHLFAQAAARYRFAHPGLVAASPAAAAAAYNAMANAAANGNSYSHPAFADNVAPFHGLSPFTRYDSRFRFMSEEPKPQHSYIGLIAMAILSSSEQKMVLSDIYQYILDNYPYFRNRGHGWRNSIRHNLSLNDCFIKSGRSPNGKGHYWAIHPANIEDFKKGDFRRRKAQRKVRKHLGLSVAEDEDSSSPTPSPSNAATIGTTTIVQSNPNTNLTNSETSALSKNGGIICATSDNSSNSSSNNGATNVISQQQQQQQQPHQHSHQHQHSHLHLQHPIQHPHHYHQLVNGYESSQMLIENMTTLNDQLVCNTNGNRNLVSEGNCVIKNSSIKVESSSPANISTSSSISPSSVSSSSSIVGEQGNNKGNNEKIMEIVAISATTLTPTTTVTVTSTGDYPVKKENVLQKTPKRQFDVESLLAPDG